MGIEIALDRVIFSKKVKKMIAGIDHSSHKVAFIQRDLKELKSLEWKDKKGRRNAFTHVYAFDKVFHQECHEHLARLLSK